MGTFFAYNDKQQRDALPRVKIVLKLRRQGYTFKVIGELLGVTPQRAHQLHAKGLR